MKTFTVAAIGAAAVSAVKINQWKNGSDVFDALDDNLGDFSPFIDRGLKLVDEARRAAKAANSENADLQSAYDESEAALRKSQALAEEQDAEISRQAEEIDSLKNP